MNAGERSRKDLLTLIKQRGHCDKPEYLGCKYCLIYSYCGIDGGANTNEAKYNRAVKMYEVWFNNIEDIVEALL